MIEFRQPGGAMYHVILSRALLILCGVLASAKAGAFAIFAVPPGTVVTPGQVLDLTVSGVVVPAQLGQGVPLSWKQTSIGVTVGFSPDPIAPLTNGTTTWNENVFSVLSEWNAVGANISYAGVAGTGDPCVTDGAVAAAFHPSVCLGILPSLALGISRIVAVVDSPSSIRIIDADVAIITPNTASLSGAMVTDAFDGPTTFPNFDFRRIVLHEFGHTLGLAHPDAVFGDTGVTLNAIMHSTSFLAFRLSADDKNGALALYPAASNVSSTGSGGGGGGNALALALLLPVLAAVKALGRRARSLRAFKAGAGA